MEGLAMKYFVLKPKGDDVYAEASRKAIRAYAAHIESTNAAMTADLRLWADHEMENSEQRKQNHITKP